ncbi:MAG TPA: cellulase [Candidatus Aphodousia gallistercoris]|nr:cellulase [Candidatus Aphodousia gallistercoris]
MIKKLVVSVMLGCAMAPAAWAWDLWQDFKAVGIENSRVVDYSDSRAVTTSEGQSYGMFFALVDGDRASFEQLLAWTENNLSQGDITKNLPSWLWGRDAGSWVILDTNNAVDSDMWIAYCLLEAGRLWERPDYTDKGRKMLELLKTQVRDIANLGKVLLPGRVGFETDDTVKLNPSYYPLFILKRFALEDAYWNEVYDGSLRVILRSAPAGISPDWATFSKSGDLINVDNVDNTIGSYNSIRVYLWAGMMSPRDPSYRLLKNHFQPMVRLTEQLNMPPEKVNVNTLEVNQAAGDGFGACLLPYLGNSKTAEFVRTVLLNSPIEKDNYYRNVLALYGIGFDQGTFAFDVDGKVYFPKAQAQKTAPAAS